MKKLFFFRSSNSSSGTNQVSPQSTDKQVYWETEERNKATKKKQSTENYGIDSAPHLRRSRSSSSAAIFDGEFGASNLFDQNGSSYGINYDTLKQAKANTSRGRALTPERKQRSKFFEAPTVEILLRQDKSSGSFSGEMCDSSDCSSYCSSNVSSGVVDRYIDGEQQQYKISEKNIFPARNHIEKGNNHQRQVPVAQPTNTGSPNNLGKQKPKVHSFREINSSQIHFNAKDWGDNGLGNTSPQKLAKHVVERLSQSSFLAKKSSRELEFELPITVEDVYSGNLSPKGNPNRFGEKDYTVDTAVDNSHLVEDSAFVGRNSYVSNNSDVTSDTEHEDGADLKLFRKFKDAERRAMLFSEELEQEDFLLNSGLSFQALNRAVIGYKEEKVEMAYQITSILKDWIADRTSMREELKASRAELDSRTRRLEKEKNELQSALEKELDRRSSDWSLKLDKYRTEEHRLRERVRELAEQNVSLQREVHSFAERETESKNRIVSMEQQLEGVTSEMEEANEKNRKLEQTLSEITEKFKVAEEERDFMRRNFDDKLKECKDLHRSITRLQRTCNEQEKTIDGLRCLCEEIQKKSDMENADNQIGKLQKELIRLTGVEHALRKEVESYRLEVDSLRFENINLLHRLKDIGKEGGFSTFKLDQELWNRICCLQNQGLSFLADSTHLCTKLLDYIKTNSSQSAKDGMDVASHGLGSQFLVECEVKLQSFSRGIESLTKSLSVVSTVLHEKSMGSNEKSHPVNWESQQKSEDMLQQELRAETLLTTLLREKLCSKELDIEQLQAEVAAAVRGNDILKAEVQSALDTLSCLTHKMKDLELQMIRKDENKNQVQNQLQDCAKELNILKGILPKVSEERDLMWGEVKKYSEENMLLTSEINQLKKKLEVLDEDVLYKEGQIAILKDALGKPFDLLGSPDSVDKYLVK